MNQLNKFYRFLFITLASILTAMMVFDIDASANGDPKNKNWLKSNNMELSAHRGSHTVVPENTLEAVEWAGEFGYGFIEIDVRKTKDGQYILMHDDTVNRTTTGSGRVVDLTWEEIQELSILDKEGNVTEYKVPTLEEALEAAYNYSLGVNFDGSKGDWSDQSFVDGIMEIAEEERILDHSFFVLSNQGMRDQFNAWYPEETVSFLGNAANNVDVDIQELQKYENAIYSTSVNNIDEASAEKIKDAGIKLHIYSVNTDEAYEKAKSMKPRLIETDVILPQKANRYLD